MNTLTPDQRAAALRGFEKRFIPEPNSGCWLWERAINYRGYGLITLNRKTFSAHRVSWVLHRGPIPPNLFVCHKCDVPCCINPDHLFLGTPRQNTQDMLSKGRSNYVIGTANGRAKLSKSAVLLIRTAAPLTRDHREQLARRFGVSIATLYRIERGVGYADALPEHAKAAE